MVYPATYSSSLEELEAECDALYPAWDSVRSREEGLRASGTPFNTLPYPRLARLKWLLKRRLQLLQEQGEWGVKVVQDNTNPLKCYAHPVPPLADGQPARPDAPPSLMERKLS